MIVKLSEDFGFLLSFNWLSFRCRLVQWCREGFHCLAFSCVLSMMRCLIGFVQSSVAWGSWAVLCYMLSWCWWLSSSIPSELNIWLTFWDDIHVSVSLVLSLCLSSLKIELSRYRQLRLVLWTRLCFISIFFLCHRSCLLIHSINIYRMLY